MTELRAPLQAQVVAWLVQPGAEVAAGEVLVILEAMKMEHEVRAPGAGRLQSHFFAAGEMVQEGDLLSNVERLWHIPLRPQPDLVHKTPEKAVLKSAEAVGAKQGERADLTRLRQRQAFTHDAARPEAVAKRHAQGLRTARENVADLCDPGSFSEYGALAVAAQRSRRV